MNTGPLLDRETIRALLAEVADVLAEENVRGRMFVVGGAAIALAFGRGRTTGDVDAVFEPKEAVYAAARRVAARHGLPNDWLNDGVKGFLLGADPDATVAFDAPGLSVEVASPRYLFVMKAVAARIDRDARDLQHLYRHSGFTTVVEALDHVQRHAPAHLLTPKTWFLLHELLADEPDGPPPSLPHDQPSSTTSSPCTDG